jgi:pyruvate kinase
MAHIVQQAEQAASWSLRFTDESVVKVTVAQAVAHASCETARDLKAKAIIAPTLSGSTARLVARFRPQAPVVAVTPSAQTQRQLMLSWGIYPLLADRETTTDRMLADAIRAAQRQGFVNLGDTVVVTAGSVGSQPGATDLMKVHVV